MLQGAEDACDPPGTSEGLDGYFDTYRRVVIPGVGHFPHREATDAVLHEALQQLSEYN
jgi:pimeloyl-ACP methyl ester carboxylesterase